MAHDFAVAPALDAGMGLGAAGRFARAPAVRAGDLFAALTQAAGYKPCGMAFLALDLAQFAAGDAAFMHDEIARQGVEADLLVFHAEALVGAGKEEIDDGLAFGGLGPGLHHAGGEGAVEFLKARQQFSGPVQPGLDAHAILRGELDEGARLKRVHDGITIFERHILDLDAVAFDDALQPFERAELKLWIDQVERLALRRRGLRGGGGRGRGSGDVFGTHHNSALSALSHLLPGTSMEFTQEWC